MIKIIKNTTGSSIFISDVGGTIAANDEFIINPLSYGIWANSSDAIISISSGDLVVNNGSEDLSITEGIRLLLGGYTNKVQIDDDLLSTDRIKIDVIGTLSDGKSSVSSNDGTSGFLEEKISAASNKIVISVDDEGADEDLQIDVDPSNILVSELNNDSGFLTETSHDALPADNPHSVTQTQVGLGNVDNTSDANKPVSTATQTALDLKYDASNPNSYETPSQLNTRDTNNRDRSNHTGTQLASTISDFTSAVQTAETTTSISLASNILTFTDEDGVDTDIDLSLYLDDTNLARITSGSLNSSTGIVTFTRDDATTFTVDFSNIIPSIEIEDQIHVAQNGNDGTGDGTLGRPYLTIGAAITEANTRTPSSTNPIMLKVGPGVFVEGPLTLPSYVTLDGAGSRTVIAASNVNSDLITAAANTTIKNLALTGVTNSSNHLLNISSTVAGASLVLNVVFSATATNGMTASSTTAGHQVIVSNCLVNGISGEAITVGNNVGMSASGILCIGNGTTTTFFRADGSGELFYSNCKDINVNKGLDLYGSGKITINGYISTADIPFSQNSATSQIEVLGGSIDGTKLSVTDITKVEGFFFAPQVDDQKLTVVSELSVGVPNRGRESSFGEGDSYSNGMFVFTETAAGSFANVTDDAKSASGSTFTFPGTAVDNAIYVTTAFDQASPLKFYGVKVDVTTATVGGEIVAEYWDGSSWVEFHTMTTESTGQYLPFAEDLFGNTGSSQVRFDKEIKEDWTTSDPVSLGLSLRWIRFRIASALTTAPVIEKMKVHSNRTEINEDGFIEYFGEARPTNTIPFTINSFISANNSPQNQDIYLSDNLGSGRIENLFQNGTIDRSGLIEVLPFDIDTSCPIELTMYLHTDAVSDDTSDWTIRWNNSSLGDSIYDDTGSAPSSSTGEQSASLSIETVDEELFAGSVMLDVSTSTPRKDGEPGDLFHLSIQRNGDSDDYSGDISIVQIKITYTKWCNGGHI